MYSKAKGLDQKAINPQILREIEEELRPVNKEEFLQDLMKERLGVLADKDLTEFDVWLKILEKKVETPETSLKEISRVTKKLAKIAKWICNGELALFEVLDK